jgi:Ca2+/H+ antiporter
VGIASVVTRDAESNWLEGAFLLIAYCILAVAFFFY